MKISSRRGEDEGLNDGFLFNQKVVGCPVIYTGTQNLRERRLEPIRKEWLLEEHRNRSEVEAQGLMKV
jgi:hypothetical protein